MVRSDSLLGAGEVWVRDYKSRWVCAAEGQGGAGGAKATHRARGMTRRMGDAPFKGCVNWGRDMLHYSSVVFDTAERNRRGKRKGEVWLG